MLQHHKILFCCKFSHKFRISQPPVVTYGLHFFSKISIKNYTFPEFLAIKILIIDTPVVPDHKSSPPKND